MVNMDMTYSMFYREDYDPDYLPGGLTRESFELICEASHNGWMEGKRKHGIKSRLSEWGEELMVDYNQLSEMAKDLDRYNAIGILTVMDALGMRVVAG